eukprot:TRINITY_DN11743_c0_g1_i3.p1 TRINITY_DN11743_c0_g1~~TRINITY_DN11743_c0_g1_i3.p1  ORF type:complete len:116 (+),score=10.80 TRINITY_DN11743_c0_g1_i3:242-589(+)
MADSPPQTLSKPTDSLVVRELLRPFAWKHLEEFLSRNGKIVKHWLHPLKKLCYVQFESEGIARRIKEDINGVVWPKGGKKLVVDFVDSADVELSLIHICRCRRYAVCRSRWSPYH